MERQPIRVAAIADLHIPYTLGQYHSTLRYRELIEEMEEQADVIAVCGDFTIQGDMTGIRKAAEMFGSSKKPVVGVLGNHDRTAAARKILEEEGGITILNGETYEYRRGIDRLVIAGVSGSCGGFDGMPTPLSLLETKFMAYHESQQQGLAKALDEGGDDTLVLMHYSPILETLAGEKKHLLPFLGSQTYREIIDSHPSKAKAVLHGHAHLGYPEGETQTGVKVFNISSVVSKIYFGNLYRILEF